MNGFAKSGDPNGKNLPAWPRFSNQNNGRNKPPYVLGEMAEFPGADVLNTFDVAYEKLLANLLPGQNK